MKSKIKILSDVTINKIAAGEVIERPVSVIKELVENSIDAKASKIDIFFRAGGKNEIVVSDNGTGISQKDLLLSIKRHATSKIQNDNLTNISTLGFRGEALSSISSVSHFIISSKIEGQSHGYEVNINANKFQYIKPVQMHKGTTVTVKNLFSNIPARLKFLKSDNYEALLIKKVIQKFSMCFLQVEFNLFSDQKNIFSSNEVTSQTWSQRLLNRASSVIGEEFIQDSKEINIEKQKIEIKGFLGVPTYNLSNSNNIFLFVNKRIITDRSLTTIIRVAYRDFIAHDRFPQLVLFLDCDPSEIDINVHPMKNEVRFKDPKYLKSLLISSIRNELKKIKHFASTSNTKKTIEKFVYEEKTQDKLTLKENNSQNIKETENFDNPRVMEDNQYPLGFAKTQLHETYIVSENSGGIIITDQHAAHERIVYEKLKKDFYSKNVKRQILLIPVVIETDVLAIENVKEILVLAEKYGVKVEIFGEKSLIVREVPIILGNSNIKQLVLDLITELIENNDLESIEEKINKVCSSMACHGSIRAGRIMEIDEMNDLLRRIESTPFSGQCNHGRPTYIELKLNDIERLFGRK